MVLLPGDDDDDDDEDEDAQRVDGNGEIGERVQDWTVIWGDHIDMTDSDESRYYDSDGTMGDWFMGNLIHAHGDNVGQRGGGAGAAALPL